MGNGHVRSTFGLNLSPCGDVQFSLKWQRYCFTSQICPKVVESKRKPLLNSLSNYIIVVVSIDVLAIFCQFTTVTNEIPILLHCYFRGKPSEHYLKESIDHIF